MDRSHQGWHSSPQEAGGHDEHDGREAGDQLGRDCDKEQNIQVRQSRHYSHFAWAGNYGKIVTETVVSVGVLNADCSQSSLGMIFD